MRKERINEAKQLAKRFMKAVAELESADIASKGYCNPKQSGALRRASMDLTRALAEMRKP